MFAIVLRTFNDLFAQLIFSMGVLHKVAALSTLSVILPIITTFVLIQKFDLGITAIWTGITAH